MPNVNSEKDLCRCCHSEGSYKNLYESHSWLDVEEAVYSKLIQECYSIEMAPITSSLQHTLCSICDSCIERLRDAVQFRRQVVKCEKRFRDVYIGCVGEGVTDNTDIKIKQEPEMKEDEIVVEVDPNGAHTSVHPSNHGPTLDDDDEDDDDDDSFGRDDDFGDDYSVKIEEKGPDKSVQVKKEDTASDSEDEVPLTQVKRAKKRKAPSKKAAAKKRARSNDDSGLAKDIEGLEIIQGKTNKSRKAPKKSRKAPKGRRRICGPEDEEELGTVDGISVIKVKIAARLVKGIDYRETEDNMFQCMHCPQIGKSYYSITAHVKSVHFNTAKYRCPICYDHFWAISQLIKHKLDKHGLDQRFKCNACNKSYYDTEALEFHRKAYHMLGEKFKCAECAFETYNRRSFKKHEVMHTNEKNHICKYCKKAFKRRYTLTQHERIHTGDKRHACPECGEAYVERTSLKYHMARRHPEVPF